MTITIVHTFFNLLDFPLNFYFFIYRLFFYIYTILSVFVLNNWQIELASVTNMMFRCSKTKLTKRDCSQILYYD